MNHPENYSNRFDFLGGKFKEQSHTLEAQLIWLKLSGCIKNSGQSFLILVSGTLFFPLAHHLTVCKAPVCVFI